MVKALIAGGGVAGPVTAMALQHAGIDAQVYEAHLPGTGDAGSYLTVATNGLDALRAVGADKPVLAAGFPTPTNVLLSGTGRRLGSVSNGGRLTDGTVSHTVKRSRLYQALHEEAASRGIRIEYGKRLAGAEPTAGGVVATFDDGSRASGDLLIGADGVHSPTRRLIDPAAPSPRYVGLVNFGGYTPGSAGSAEPGAWHMIFGRRAFFGYVADPAGGTVWFANVPRLPVTPAERAATTAEQWQRQLVELFAGDAAHAPSPTSGQGASLAAEDAVVLAKCLRGLPDIPEALATYEGLRRKRVERIVAQAARTSSAKTPGPLGRILRDLTLPLVFKLLVTDRSMAWIYDHHIDWDAPLVATNSS